MKYKEALEKLELEVGASQKEIQQQYQEFYNEFQMRITNAPTTYEKNLYQQKLKLLEEVYTLLTGKNTENIDAGLPWASPGEATTRVQNNFLYPKISKMTKPKALELLSLQEPFTKGKLEDAFNANKSKCEASIKNAFNEEMAESGRKALKELEQAYQLLLPLATAPTLKTKPQPKAAEALSKETKKTNPIIWGFLLLVVIAGALFVLKPWEPSIDPAVQQQFTTLKAEANLLATQKNWQEALAKYKAAQKLIPELAVQDSITSIGKRLDAIAQAKETKLWEAVKKANTIKGYKEYLTAFQNGFYNTEAESAITKIEAYIKSEAGKKRLAAEKAAAKRHALEEKLKSLPSPIQNLLRNFVYVRGGTFTMGCTSEQGSDCYSEEKPAHEVSVSSFNIGKYEVTQAQWLAVMGSNPSKFKNCNNCPVEWVSWNEVQSFIRKLASLTGKRFRLPREAEWEFAARGGTKSQGYKFAGSNSISGVAWYWDNTSEKTHPVGQKQSNELGLYDMNGNVMV
jgi:hypothetical protein